MITTKESAAMITAKYRAAVIATKEEDRSNYSKERAAVITQKRGNLWGHTRRA